MNRTTESFDKNVFRGYGIILSPVAPRDLHRLRHWRNSARIIQHQINRSQITPRMQIEWYRRQRDNSYEGHWVAWVGRHRVGAMKISGLDKTLPLECQQRVNVGAYVGDSEHRAGLLGYAIALMQLNIVFEFLSVLEINTYLVKTNERGRTFNKHLGYIEGGLVDDLIPITNTRVRFKKAEKRLARYFSDAQCEKFIN